MEALPGDDPATAMRGAGIVCFRPSPAFSALAEGFVALPKALTTPFAPGLTGLTRTDNGIYAIPLAIDHGQIAYDEQVILRAGMAVPGSIQEFERDAGKLSKSGILPLSFSGAQDRSLLLLVSCLLSGPEGNGPYDALAVKLAQGADFPSCLDYMAPGAKTNLRAALKKAASWIKAGYLHPDCLAWTDKDLVSFMENDRTAFVLCYLSQIRGFGEKALTGYSSMRFFPYSGADSPSSVTPLLAAGLPKKSPKAGKSLEFLRYASSMEGQARLSSLSGRGPASGAAVASDRAAADARTWAMSSVEPLQGLDAAFTDNGRLKGFCDDVRAFIRSEIYNR
jgi:ABC-type glycerol-3-phosphate transport system substrate-binding protein